MPTERKTTEEKENAKHFWAEAAAANQRLVSAWADRNCKLFQPKAESGEHESHRPITVKTIYNFTGNKTKLNKKRIS